MGSRVGMSSQYAVANWHEQPSLIGQKAGKGMYLLSWCSCPLLGASRPTILAEVACLTQDMRTHGMTAEFTT